MQHHYSGHWKGWALKISTFLGPNGNRFARAISGPKKVSIFRAHPFQYPFNDVAPLKIITYCAIKTTGTLIVQRLVAGCHSLCLFFIFNYIHTFIQSHFTFIQYIYSSPFAEASLHFFIACLLSGKDLPVQCRAENRTRACLTASRRATN